MYDANDTCAYARVPPSKSSKTGIYIAITLQICTALQAMQPLLADSMTQLAPLLATRTNIHCIIVHGAWNEVYNITIKYR